MAIPQQPSQLATYLPVYNLFLANSKQVYYISTNLLATAVIKITSRHWKVCIYFQSQMIEKSQLKKFERVQVEFNIYLCVIRNFIIANSNQLPQLPISYKRVKYGSTRFFNQSPEQHRQNSIYTFHISQKMSFSIFFVS